MTQKTFFSACVIVINMVIGSGVLAIPHAFLSAGVVLAPFVLSMFAFTAFCTVIWLFECQIRAWALNEVFVTGKLSLKAAGSEGEEDYVVPLNTPSLEERNLVPAEDDEITVGDDLESALGEVSANHVTTPFITHIKQLCSKGRFFRYSLDQRKESSAPSVDFNAFSTDDVLEMDDVATAFGGRLVAAAWNLSQVLFITSGTWLYFVVLCETALQGIGLGTFAPRNHCNRSNKEIMDTHACQSGVRIYCGIFWALLGALTMRDWRIMPYVQRSMTILVYVGLSSVTITALIGLFTKEYVSPVHGAPAGHHSSPYSRDVNNADFSKFSELFGAAVFCLLCHPGASIMARGMPSKESALKVYALAFGGIVGMYIIMASVVVFYMGSDTSSIVTLNWSNYNEWGIPGWGGQVFGGFVMLFPIASISASLTLYVRSLAESVEAMLPVSFLSAACRLIGVEYHAKVWQVQLVLRLVCISGPATLCMISSNFSTALAVAGFFAFFLIYFVPCVLQIESRRLMKKAGVSCPCDSWLGHPVVVFGTLIIALAACGYYVKASLIPAFQH